MSCRRRCAVAIAVLALGCVVPEVAGAAVRARVTAEQRGWIGLRVGDGRARSVVTVWEGHARRAQFRLGRHGRALVRRVASWRCAPRERTLVVDDGRAGQVKVSTRTPGCGRRLGLRLLPRHLHAGRRFGIRLSDRWHLGRLAATVCLIAPPGTRGCTPLRVGPVGATVRLAAPRPGRWRIEVRGAGLDTGREVIVRPAGRRLSMLAAGDSLMIPVARKLTRLFRRRGAIVRTDIHFAGISNAFNVDWPVEARATAHRWRPDVVVLLLGGAEGWPFGSVACCDEPWTAAYAARAADMATSYLRGGAAQVYWLSLPAAENSLKAPPFQAANTAVGRTLAALSPWARQLDLAGELTPGFVYRREMPIDGRTRIVRLVDGLHLAWAGANLATGLVIRALEADGILDAPVTG